MALIRLIFALMATMIVPVAGYMLSDHVTIAINSELASMGYPSFDEICNSPVASLDFDLRIICIELRSLPLLKQVSIYAAIFGASIPAMLLTTSIIVGRNRSLLAWLFPVVVQAVLYVIVLSVLLQGMVLTVGSMVAQAWFLGRVRLYLTAGVGIGALALTWKLFDGMFSFGERLRSHVVGTPVPESKAPGLHAFVSGLAEKLGAQPPDNIVVGLEPNFFVTAAEIVTPKSGRPLQGNTLYVSLPLARLMTVSEYAAVVGHELGHFRGADTEYSLKFAPVYAGLAGALSGTAYEKGERYRGLAKLPARAMLSFMMDIFAMNERAIGRVREMLADQAGAEAASSRALGTALVKVSLYAGLWHRLHFDNVERLNRGKATRNLSSLLESWARYDFERGDVKKILAAVAKQSTPHPTDTHPPLAKRLKALNVSLDSIGEADLLVPDQSAMLLFRNATVLEERLSIMEHKHMADLGLAPATGRGSGGAGRHLSAIYRIAVAMKSAEGGLDANALRAAENFGTELFPEFDSTDFRQACDYADEIPDLDSLIETLNELLDAAQKNSVVAFLRRVAEANGDVSLAEQVYIDSVAEELGVAGG